jgi:hypothetical protein
MQGKPEAVIAQFDDVGGKARSKKLRAALSAALAFLVWQGALRLLAVRVFRLLPRCSDRLVGWLVLAFDFLPLVLTAPCGRLSRPLLGLLCIGLGNQAAVNKELIVERGPSN